MAVKIVCSVCGEFIKDANEFQSLTGKETCERCGKRIDELFQHMDNSIRELDANIQKLYNDAKKIYGKLEGSYKRFTNETISLRTTMTAELNSMKDDIVK